MLPLLQQPGGGGRQADTIALQFLHGVATGRKLGQGFFGLAAGGPAGGLRLAGLRHPVTQAVDVRRGAAGLVGVDAGTFNKVVALSLGDDQLGRKR